MVYMIYINYVNLTYQKKYPWKCFISFQHLNLTTGFFSESKLHSLSRLECEYWLTFLDVFT